MINILERSNEVFAEAAFAVANVNRYGLKSCVMSVDPDLAHDLIELYKWYKEMEVCDTTITNSSCTGSMTCSLQSIEERIKTL